MRRHGLRPASKPTSFSNNGQSSWSASELRRRVPKIWSSDPQTTPQGHFSWEKKKQERSASIRWINTKTEQIRIKSTKLVRSLGPQWIRGAYRRTTQRALENHKHLDFSRCTRRSKRISIQLQYTRKRVASALGERSFFISCAGWQRWGTCKIRHHVFSEKEQAHKQCLSAFAKRGPRQYNIEARW